MMSYRLLIAAVLALVCWTGGAEAQQNRFDVAECREQAQAFARLDIDCVLIIRASEKDLAQAPVYLQALMGALECQVPLKFEKAKVYGVWITKDRVNPPPIKVTCRMLSGPDIGELSGVFDADCVRSQGEWTCYPGLREVVGFGPLGTVVEDFVNNDPTFPRFLAKQLAKFD